MGLDWSKEKIVKDNTLILITAVLPRNNSEKLWELYKTKKTELRADGFSIGKNERTGSWEIKYFAELNANSLARNANNEIQAVTEFKAKINKWNSVYNNVTVKEKVPVKKEYNKKEYVKKPYTKQSSNDDTADNDEITSEIPDD